MVVEPEPDVPRDQAQAQKDGASTYVVGGSIDRSQFGNNNTLITYSLIDRTWTDRSGAPPLINVSGDIESPYRGLGAFEERDAPFFFGRDNAAMDVLERMSRCLGGTGLLMVSGVSGAGKSSLLRAGVLPRLRGEGLATAPEAMLWPCQLFTPSHAPLDELATQVASLAGVDAAAVRRHLIEDPTSFALTARQAAIAQAGTPAQQSGPRQARLLLVIDQFEQLFTRCPDEGQRRAFISALHAAATVPHGEEQAPAALVVIGVRADFEARCTSYPQLLDAVQDRYLVTPMTEPQLRAAVTEPARVACATVTPALVEALLEEIRTHAPPPFDDPRLPAASGAGLLPHMSHALDNAWRQRADPTLLTLADYVRTGQIEGAIAKSAQHAYATLTPAQTIVARQVFVRLTAAAEDGINLADRVTRTELFEGRTPAQVRDVETVLEAFATHRLLILAVDTVEISHEVLLTAWPRLRDTWLTETHTDRIIRTRLRTTAAEWKRDGQDSSYLYKGSLLETAKATATRIDSAPVRHLPFNPAEQDFLHASDRAHRRSVRRRQSFTGFLVALVIGLTAVAITAYRARQDAVHQRDIAVSGQLISQSEALSNTDPTISKLESLAAWRINPSAQARYAMLAAVTRPEISTLTGHTGGVTSVVFSPDAKTLATASTDQTVRLWGAATHQQIGQPLTGHTGGIASVVFSPDGRTLATASTDQTVRLWDVTTHQQIGQPLTGHTGAVTSVAFSPDAKTLATASTDQTVRLWDVTTHQQIGQPFTGHTGAVASVVFSPDGRTLATASADRTVRLWGAATHQQIGQLLTGHTGGIASVVFSPDAKTLATASTDQTVRLWDVTIHQQIGQPFTGHTGAVASVVFSPDGRTLATASYDQTVRLWGVASRQQIGQLLTGHTGGIDSVVFSPDGRTLATASTDQTVRLWGAASRQQIGQPLTGHTGGIDSVVFSPDGRTLATASTDQTVRLWDVTTHQQIGQPLTGHNDSVYSVAFSPDAKTLATASADQTVRLWDVTTHQQIGQPFTGHAGAVYSVAFSPDAKTLATAGADQTVRLWDVTTHQQIGQPLTGHTDAVASVAFSPDAKTLATAGADQTVRLWDVTTHQQIGQPFTGHTGGVDSVVFSPDGRTLATAGYDQTVRLWDVTAHQQIGQPLTGHTDPVASVAFSPDGRTLATAGYDQTVRLWDVDYVLDVLPKLCAQTGRSLTSAEWARYVPPGPAYRPVCP
ncbi:NACHT and WD repeat domain-containing protein [Streptomyces sp. H39-S7]|uniref:NACHT and WD repeat domain-containing protein n=1 Tax=Streptomyces sp. H39-S7 TaxID=3004357 RepID=UPI0022AEBD4C|nr:DNA-binding protein [Streptomyces sp. H39-S7]MCZ4120283.1 DNA-binding protein [Streptomyces sp. H39-S7]